MKHPKESDADKSIYPCLVPFPTKNDSQPIKLEPSEITVGRAPSNNLELSHGGVSRFHARISHENGQHILTDLNSRNGTFVNNKRINQATLSHNDKIFLGNRGKKVIGAIHIDTKDYENPFVQNDMEFTAAVSNELVLSIENGRLQKEAIKNEKMVAIGLTITNLAHNIKNLVTMNTNAVDMMDVHLKTIKDENLQKNWHFVSQGLERIASLTADMLEYSQNGPVDLKPIDINSTILLECEMFKENPASEDIELELELAPNLPAWEINDFRLQRAILNLVVNAKDALTDKKSGCIKISTAMEDNQRLVIRVSDNGCGIYKDKLKKIFELFYTTKGMDGSGLGLSIVQKFVESLEGKVSVISQVDVGSTFSMVFPKNPE